MIHFTESCEEAIRQHDLSGFVRRLKSQLESYTSVSVSDTDAETGQVDTGVHVLELKLKALILDTIHNIEVVEQLNTSSLTDVADWQWQKQLRLVSCLCFQGCDKSPLFGCVYYQIHCFCVWIPSTCDVLRTLCLYVLLHYLCVNTLTHTNV